MEPQDIELLTSFSRPSVAPDGSFAVYAASTPNCRANRNLGQLWRVELGDAGPGSSGDRTPPRLLTRGMEDSAPALSPDGTRLAFLRPDDRGRRQLHVIDPRGGEVLRITDQHLGVQTFRWSPGGDRIAFTARVPERGRYGTVDGLPPEQEAARRITGVRWNQNGLGYVEDRPLQVFLVRAASPEEAPIPPVAPHVDGPLAPHPEAASVQLTNAAADHPVIGFSADGTRLLAVREDHGQPARDLRTSLVSIRLDPDPLQVLADGGEASIQEELLLSPADGFHVHELGVTPDGAPALLASRPVEGRDAIAPDVALWLLEEDGPRRITDPEALDVGAAGSEIVALGEDVLLRAAVRGRVHMVRVGPDGSTSTILGEDMVVQGMDATVVAGREVVLATVATPDSAGRIVVLAQEATDAGNAAAMLDPVHPAPTGLPARTLVDGSEELRRSADLILPQELEITGRTGYPVHGWLALPHGAEEAPPGTIPLILMIHGGPYAAYDVAVFDEVQTLTRAGYAVVYGNPRGSAGYGREHGRAVRHAFGTVDFEDVIDLLDGALARDPRLDRERLGIMGGSYGGYLTAWTIAHDHRFRGAIVERGFLDPLSFQGTSDIGSFFGDEYVGTEPDEIDRASALSKAGQVRTPTLVIHSEQDLRCPLEQGTRYYSALRRAGVETEMLIFPGEDHELTRSGQPRHRVQRFEALLEWWERMFGQAG